MTNPLLSDDPEVWNSLITGIHPDALLVVISHRMGVELRKHVAAEDILQEALFKAWRARSTFTWQGAPSFRRWIIRIAENCVEDQREWTLAKRRSTERTTALATAASGDGGSSLGAVDLEPWTSTTPSRMAEARERASALQRSLDALPDEVRDVVRLRLFEDLQIDEIAEKLNLGSSAVRYRFRKGAEQYRELLRTTLGSSSTPGA
jgi:RNA polymerase sigma-70 factor (ECF subfamily)